MKQISAVKGRVFLMLLVLLAALVAFGVLFWIGRGGAIHPEARREAMTQFLGVYLPLLVLMTGFYVGEKAVAKQVIIGSTSRGELAVVVLLTGIWLGLPSVCLLATETVEEALRTLKVWNPYGQSVGNAAVAFYFSRGRG